MTLIEKIKIIYSSLTNDDFGGGVNARIIVQNDSDGKGDYIAEWEHPTLPRPTEEQLNAV